MIVAMSENRVIGKDNKLLWRLPIDMKHFKETTLGHHVIMGRKTFESFRSPLKDRTNIIVTRNMDYPVDEPVVVASSIREALKIAEVAGDEEAFIIGGGEIYSQALGETDRIYLTIIHATLEGDTSFPEIDESEWKEVNRRAYAADEHHAYPISIMTLERKLK